jgi:16S rRNA processing protein RimM
LTELVRSMTGNSDQLLEIGSIKRAHGLMGDVLVKLVTNRFERLDPGSSLSTAERNLIVVSSSPHQDNWIVHFEGVATKEAADALRGLMLLAPPIQDSDELWIHELMGASVREMDGTDRGTVVAVLSNPASDLLELDSGSLIPLRFVVEFADSVISVDVPTGLFDLGN